MIYSTIEGSYFDHDSVSGLVPRAEDRGPEPAVDVSPYGTGLHENMVQTAIWELEIAAQVRDEALRERSRFCSWQDEYADEVGIPAFGPI